MIGFSSAILFTEILLWKNTEATKESQSPFLQTLREAVIRVPLKVMEA